MEIEPELIEVEKRASEYLREWGFDADKFEARAKESLASAKGDLSEITGALRQTMNRTKQVLLDLQLSRGAAVNELKSGFERGWNAIEESFIRARQRVRESSLQPSASQPPEQPEQLEEGDPDWWS